MYIVRKSLSRFMSVFTQKLNPLVGKVEWEVQSENYDYHQEIARSAFADMLHDTERNQKYYRAIKLAVEKMHAQNQKAHVLDIGTGTGLLSMMAVTCGADSVTACECFWPVAECAKRIMKANGFADKIKLVPKNSLRLKVGRIGDMPQKASILVTEVFDTELIGEGAIQIFAHAHNELLDEDCIVVPHAATVYAQVVESPLANDWRKIKSIVDTDDGSPIIQIRNDIKDCVGSPAVHDIQLNQFPITHFKTILPPMAVLKFDWSGKTNLQKTRNNVMVEKAEQNGTAQIVFMWWDLQMDQEGEIVLSCAPYWAHPQIDEHNKNPEYSLKDCLPWRDHWMQAVYFLPQELRVEKGQDLIFTCSHDECSLWFNLKTSLSLEDDDYKKPLCQCGLHFVFSRTRIGQMNDSTRNKKYLEILRNKINSETVCLCLSEGSVLALIAAQLGAKKVYVISNMHMIQVPMQKLAEHNNLNEKMVFLEDVDELIQKRKDEVKDLNLIIGEPHFCTSLLPWHNLRFMYVLKKELSPLLSPNAEIMPKKATIHMMPVNFYHLHKIKASLVNCEGFDMKIFDDLIKLSSSEADTSVEPQPLWEYPCKPISLPNQVTEFDIASFNPLITREVLGEVKFTEKAVMNGITLWVDWHLDNSPRNKITTGPILPPELNQEVKWDMYTRQGVYLFRDPIQINPKDILHYTAVFKSDEILFEFRLNGKII